jgi:tetratricopeptide (TPR) repeat protein
MIFFSKLLILIALILDLLVVVGFWLGNSYGYNFVIIHVSASVMNVFFLCYLLKKKQLQLTKSYVTYLLSLCLLLPFLGNLEGCVLIALAITYRNRSVEHLIKLVERQYDAEPLVIRYGEGGINAHLQSKQVPLANKTAALFAMGSSKLNQTNLILQDMLHAKQEDLRLLSFALLEYQEKDINTQISQTIALLEELHDPYESAKLQKQIAQLYWELVYRQLNPDMREVVLGHARDYAEKALSILGDQASLWVLLGKIYYRLNQVDKAEEMFTKAKALGAPLEHFVSYMAEDAYRKRDFDEVKKLFSFAAALNDTPTIGPVARFWTERYDANT